MRLRSASTSRRPLIVWLLVGALAILALGGLSGAWMFLADPTGARIGMADTLQKLPVESFLLPGLFLLVAMFIFPLFLVYGLVRMPDWRWADRFFGRSTMHWTWISTVALGIGLIGWLLLQTVYIGFSAPAQYFTAGLAVVILALALVPPTKRELKRARHKHT